MENLRSSAILSYEDWVKSLNHNTKFSADSKLKPKATSSHLQDKNKQVRREKKIVTTEIWIG